MNKIKIVNRMGISQLVVRSRKGQQLSEREVYAINHNEVRGLLRLEVEEKGSTFKLIYNISGFISFREYLRTPLTKASFVRILQNVLDNLKSMQAHYFNQQMILLDFDRILVNPATQKIYFIYVPITSFESGASLRNFLLNIIQFCTFSSGEDTEYIRDYIMILNRGINFSVFELEEYIKRLSGERTERHRAIGNTCVKCGAPLKVGANFCPMCGIKVSQEHAGERKVYNPLSDGDVKSSPQEKQTGGSTQGFSDGTVVLGFDPGGTTVLGSDTLYAVDYPYLIREKNQEKIFVDKPSFRIGKERQYSDYFVSDNNAVSRSHADIITRNGRYYIVDRNSTNKTYVDGRAIPPERETEIFAGTRLRLANEEFTFYIK